MNDEDYYKQSRRHAGRAPAGKHRMPTNSCTLTPGAFFDHGEFVQGFEDLAHINNGVAVFGSARTRPIIRSIVRPRNRRAAG